MNSGRFIKGHQRTFAVRKCLRCDQSYVPTAAVQKYCGSQRVAGTCAWSVVRERQVVSTLSDEDHAVWLSRVREVQRCRLYGMTSVQYDSYVTKQGGRCAICGRLPKPVRGVPGVLAIDHDHVTLDVRGFLCNDCNTALGLLGEDPVRLRAAADYLEKAKMQPLPFKRLPLVGKRPRIKLAAQDVARIRTLVDSGEFSQQEIAERYGVTQSNVACIVNRVTWKEVA